MADIAALTSLDVQIESSLAQFREAAVAEPLTAQERELVVRQASNLLEQAYVHLPLKKAMHAIDPVQRLRLLSYRSQRMSDRRFHDVMIAVFMSLRDLHTSYFLPDPYRTKTAFLPFLVEEFFEEGEPSWVVTKLLTDFKHRHFKPGVTVHHWNGIPFGRAVAINADRQAGSNEHARHVQGLDTMTIRPLAMSPPPDEDWVVIGYRTPDGKDHETRFDWQIFEPRTSPQGVSAEDAASASSRAIGINAKGEAVRRAKKTLFARAAMEAEERAEEGGDVADNQSTLPDVLSFRTVKTESGTFGYIRIWTFNVDPEPFLAECVRILGLLPQNGLILDVRSNGGGVITSGEKLLQLLTPKAIDPCRLSFINTRFTLGLAEANDFLAQWQPSIAQAVETGASYSYGFPIEPVEEFNRLGQQYCGPVVLITDALCYSTTDIFAAGFQDHAIGPILGTSGNTGAGGANVVTHRQLRQLQAEKDTPFVELPKRANFQMAIRRTTRVGGLSGAPLEDLGVVPDHIHRMSLRDVVGSNEDLIGAAGKLLAGLPVRVLEPTIGPKGLSVRTGGISRLDVSVDGRPRASLDVADGRRRVPVAPGAVELRGYDQGQLVAARRVTVPDPATAPGEGG